jgi:hypothetical protein
MNTDNTHMATARLMAANTWLQEEIKRLRLTDKEREAIAEAVGAYNDNDDDEECAKIAATLHGILKRLG